MPKNRSPQLLKDSVTTYIITNLLPYCREGKGDGASLRDLRE